MLVIVAAAIAVSVPSTRPTIGASVQATATIRVISGVRVGFGADLSDADVPRARDTVVKRGGEQQPAKLIEFQ
ncbi:MAG: hypothetical protein ABI454_00505 [Sphingomicrobium sp.]